jgi:hypothetical protein
MATALQEAGKPRGLPEEADVGAAIEAERRGPDPKPRVGLFTRVMRFVRPIARR